ncbi:MAG TPA: HAD-IB family phosphatase, partial [Pararhizobium sp.]|nr:HAD-IB family phosphatase [Pararhizobium sp.]
MALVATLIADPAVAALTSEIAERATAAVPANDLRWLSPGVACDILLGKNAARQTAEKSLRDALGPAPIDVVVQEAAARRKAFLIADMDSTMIGQECIDELAAEIGLKDKVAAITARAMNGEIAFEPALRERVALLEGLPLSVIRNVLETRITLAAGGPELVRTMNANGAYTALVSGGFTLFTGPIAEMIGFDEHRANILMEKDGVLTGKVMEPILGRQAKTDALHDITQRLGI